MHILIVLASSFVVPELLKLVKDDMFNQFVVLTNVLC